MIKKHTLYLGLNDKATKHQEIDTVTAYKLVMQSVIGCGYEGASVSECTGFYTHQDGQFTIEKSLRIEILFASDKNTLQLVEELKKLFNQESIALQTESIESKLV